MKLPLIERAHPDLGRLGVFWHTQGSGKSYSMVMFAEKVRRHIRGNFTFVIATDREDLDDQIFRTFVGCGIADEKTPRARSGKELKQLLAYFDDPPCPLESIEPVSVQGYLDWRSPKAKVRANRVKALLSHIWNWARSKGYTKLANPCAGIKGNKETGRDVYVEDDAFNAVWKLGIGRAHV